MTSNTFNSKPSSNLKLTADTSLIKTSLIKSSQQTSIAKSSKQAKAKSQNITSTMDKALTELKIRAKRLLKAYKQDPQVLCAFDKILRKQKWDSKQELKLKDCQNLLAIKCGFKSWQEAQRILTGKAVTGAALTGTALTGRALTTNEQSDVESDGLSAFWYSPSCGVLLNQWFASYGEAKQVLTTNTEKVLLPYNGQFVVVDTEYLSIIGFTNKSANLLHAIKRDLVESYGSNEWDELAKQVLMAKLDK